MVYKPLYKYLNGSENKITHIVNNQSLHNIMKYLI